MEGAPEPRPWSAENIVLVSRAPLRPDIASLVPRAISARDAWRLYWVYHGPDEVHERVDFVATVVAASARGEDDPAELGRHAADIIAGGYAPVRVASGLMYRLAWRVCASREAPRDRRSIAAQAMVIWKRLETYYAISFGVYFSAPFVLDAATAALLDDAPRFAGVVACGPAAARRATMGGLPRLWARVRREWSQLGPEEIGPWGRKIEPSTLEFRSRAEFIRRRRRTLESNATACALWRAAATAGAATLGRRADVARLATGFRFCAGSSPRPGV